ncbi:unannotated protein [freshwater metagenome]|uniref:Unannotated protein n=1 Tax=freshwater metagenome TaxID=449393 RepID=A0A6J6NB01_9ZZZZ
MARTAIGLIAGPDKPPVLPPNLGCIVFKSITIPSKVLINANPSTPAFITDVAISTMSVTSGDNLAIIGSSPPIFLLTLSITALAVSGWQAKTCPRFSTLGQEILTSIALIP